MLFRKNSFKSLQEDINANISDVETFCQDNRDQKLIWLRKVIVVTSEISVSQHLVTSWQLQVAREKTV